jgi:hypothetical protein
VTVLSLSPAGADLVERLKAVRRAALARVLDGWTPEERTIFARLLERFVDGLEAAIEPEPAATSGGSRAKRTSVAPVAAQRSLASEAAR